MKLYVNQLMPCDYVKNPITNRMIKVGGKTYNEVVKKHPSIKKAPCHSLPSKNATAGKKTKPVYPKSPPPNIKKEAKTIPKTRVARKKHEMELGTSGRGERTRGWAAAAPQRGSERHEMKKKCGNPCFLNPEKEGFPICRALRITNGNCEVDCRGLAAAKIRARQYGYSKTAKEAERLERIYGC